MNEDLCFQTVSELAKQIASGALSPVELTRAYVERSQALNEKLSAIITLTAEHAMQQAAAAEKEIQAGHIRGPLHGIPYAVKDLLDTKGIRTTGGSTIYKDRVPERDATVIDRLNTAGAVLIAKLAMNEFASGANNNNLVPQPRNPWKLDRSPAGSSSGPGASTAAAMNAFSMGSETGGSIMGPSAANGVCGMRPTYSRVSRYGAITLAWSLDKLGPIARSATDIGLVLEVIAGPDLKDQTSNPASAFKFNADPGKIAGRKIGIIRHEFEIAPQANQVVFGKALDVLNQAGFVFEDVVLPQYPYGEVYNLISNAEAGTVFKPLFNDKRIAGRFDPVKRADWMAASMMPASDYMTAQRIRAMIKKDADEISTKYVALVAPTSPTGSQLLKEYVQRAADPAVRAREDIPGAALTTMSNLAGIPGVSIPCGFDSDGMPLALHITSRAWSEQSVLDVAMVFQKETDWHRKRPSLRP